MQKELFGDYVIETTAKAWGVRMANTDKYLGYFKTRAEALAEVRRYQIEDISTDAEKVLNF